MDDLRCPHCRSGILVSGACIQCGWSLAQAVPVFRRPQPPVQAATGPDCWVLLTLAAAMANFFLPMVCRAAESPYPVMFTMGILAAELAVLSVVAALGSSRNALRLALTFCVAALLLLVLVTGFVVALGDAVGPDTVRGTTGFVLLLPILLLSAQAPLWLYRGISGRRLEEPAADEDMTRLAAQNRTFSGERHEPSSPILSRRQHRRRQKPQFAVSQMLTATALIAVSLALARGALAVWSVPNAGANNEGGLIPVVLVCAVLALASALVTLPCALAMLVAQRPAAWVVPVLVYGVLVPVFVLLVGTVIAGGWPPHEELAWLGVLAFTTFAATLAALGIIRKSGYALA